MKNYFISETHVSEIIHVILAIVFVYVRLVKARGDVSITKTTLYSQDDIFSRRVCSVTDIQADSRSSRKYFVHLKGRGSNSLPILVRQVEGMNLRVRTQGAHPGSYWSYVLELIRMKYIAQCWSLRFVGCVRANARVEYTIFNFLYCVYNEAIVSPHTARKSQASTLSYLFHTY
jgi:hypothetical protein